MSFICNILAFNLNFIYFQFKNANQNDLMDSKLRCVFEMPVSLDTQQIQNSIDVNATQQTQMEPPKSSPKVCKYKINIQICKTVHFFFK